jgi:flagellar L-ring protein precursor FlgH
MDTDKEIMMIRKTVLSFVFLGAAFNAFADSLFTQAVASGGPLVSDLKARFEVGDIITVIVRETVNASTTAGTNTKKESDVEAQANAGSNQFFVADNPGLNILNEEELPNWQVEAENETRTTGTETRRSKLELTITCMVMRVIDDELLLVEGEKRVTVNREDTFMRVSGIVRARDVSASNTIASNQLANAAIELKGKGPLWNNSRRGIFTKILDWFSPF